MARYTIRIVLHRAGESDYDVLHEEMEIAGFSRTVEASGVRYALPPGEYNYVGGGSIDLVMERAKDAAAATERRYSVLVTEAVRRKWHDLDIAQDEEDWD